jgi:hypothetical protein
MNATISIAFAVGSGRSRGSSSEIGTICAVDSS